MFGLKKKTKAPSGEFVEALEERRERVKVLNDHSAILEEVCRLLGCAPRDAVAQAKALRFRLAQQERANELLSVTMKRDLPGAQPLLPGAG